MKKESKGRMEKWRKLEEKNGPRKEEKRKDTKKEGKGRRVEPRRRMWERRLKKNTGTKEKEKKRMKKDNKRSKRYRGGVKGSGE